MCSNASKTSTSPAVERGDCLIEFRPLVPKLGNAVLFEALLGPGRYHLTTLRTRYRSAGAVVPRPDIHGRMNFANAQSVGEVIHGAAQFLQVKWLWENRLHLQSLVGFADFW